MWKRYSFVFSLRLVSPTAVNLACLPSTYFSIVPNLFRQYLSESDQKKVYGSEINANRRWQKENAERWLSPMKNISVRKNFQSVTFSASSSFSKSEITVLRCQSHLIWIIRFAPDNHFHDFSLKFLHRVIKGWVPRSVQPTAKIIFPIAPDSPTLSELKFY